MAKNNKKCSIPKFELEALAEVLYPTLKKCLSSPKDKTEFLKCQERKRKMRRNAIAKTTNEG